MKSQRLGLLRLYRNLDKILLLFFTVFMLMELAWVLSTPLQQRLCSSRQDTFSYLIRMP